MSDLQPAGNGLDFNQLLNNGNVRRYLDMLAAAEGTDTHNYTTAFGGGRIESLNDHPRVRHSFNETTGNKNTTTAAGRYQFLESTWDDQARKLGLRDFSPRSQDIAAISILKDTGALPDILNGNWDSALSKTGNIWASLPTSPYPQPRRSRDFVMSKLEGDQAPATRTADSLTVPELVEAYKRAKAENRESAIPKLEGMLKQRFDAARSKAQQEGRPQDHFDRLDAYQAKVFGGAVNPQNTAKTAQEPPQDPNAATVGNPQQTEAPEPSERDMGGIPPTSQPAPMYAGTTSSFTTPVETQGGAVLTTRRKGIAGGKQVMPEDSLGMTLANAVDPFVRGVADAATFGYADELAALAGEKTGLNPTVGAPFGSNKAPVPLVPEKPQSYQSLLNRERAIDTQGGLPRLVGQVGGSLLPTNIAIQAPAALGRGGRALVGAGTGGAQGFLYGTGSSEGLNWSERTQDALPEAGYGALAGGVLGGILSPTLRQRGGKFVEKAGSEADAVLNAEIANAMVREFNNPARIVEGALKPLTPKAMNQRVIGGFLDEAKTAINNLPKDFQGKKELLQAVNKGTGISQDSLDRLKTITGGPEVAAVIARAQRAESMTEQMLQNPTAMSTLIRAGINAVPPAIGGYVGGLPGAVAGGTLSKLIADPLAKKVTGKMTRTEVGQNIIDQLGDVAPYVLNKYGTSDATKGLGTLQELAQKAQADAAAKTLASKTESDAIINAAEQLRQSNIKNFGIEPAPRLMPQNRIGGGSLATLQYYGRVKNAAEARKGLDIIAEQEPYLKPYIELLKDNKNIPQSEMLLHISDRLLMLREQGVLAPFTKGAAKTANVAEGALTTTTKAQKPKAEPKGEKVDIKEPPALTKATKETSQTLPEDVQERLKRENEASLKAIFPGGVPDWFKPGPF